MKNLSLLCFSICLIAFIACKPKVEPKVDAATGLTYFGEEFEAKDVMSQPNLVSKVKTQDTVETQVKGLVTSVCQAKGCWITLADKNDPEGESFFVKFKDYAFFMPLDLAGTEVTLNGKAYKEVTSVEELKHYAEDEGQSPEEIAAITEPVEELKFMASGVMMAK